jgi:CRP/FNR family transcriptional regulator
LKNIPILSEFSSRVIGEITKKMVEKKYRAGELIIKEGDLGREFYVIASGRVRVVKSLGEDGEFTITKLGEGEFFGEIALIHDAKRASSVVAIDDCKLMVLSKENFDLFIKKSGEFHKRVESVSTRRLHTMKS